MGKWEDDDDITDGFGLERVQEQEAQEIFGNELEQYAEDDIDKE